MPADATTDFAARGHGRGAGREARDTPQEQPERPAEMPAASARGDARLRRRRLAALGVCSCCCRSR